jgi:hypothetical protein
MTFIETLLFGQGIRSLKPGLLIYNEVGQDREHGAARGALEPPDGDSTEPDTHIMRVAGQAPAATTGRLVGELKAQGQHEGEDQFHKGLAVAKELKVGGFILEINSDGPVCTGLAGGASHGSPSGQMVGVADDPRWGYDCTIARESRRVSGRYHEIRWNVGIFSLASA